jgi:histidinol-phosphatase
MEPIGVDPALLECAVDLCRRAGALAAAGFGLSLRDADHKPDGSLVTEVDRDVESFLIEAIGQRYPTDGVIGEEHGERRGTSGQRWIVDPIDGTEAFVHGVAEFCTLVAVEDGHGISLGVIDVPVLGETFWAGRGTGAFLNGEPIHMTDPPTLVGAYVATSDLDDWPDPVVAAALEAGLRLRTWGGGYGMGLALSGRVDAFVDYDLDLWDVAPAMVLASEAGGIVTALDGTARPDGGACLIAPPSLHAELMRIFGERVQ